MGSLCLLFWLHLSLLRFHNECLLLCWIVVLRICIVTIFVILNIYSLKLLIGYFIRCVIVLEWITFKHSLIFLLMPIVLCELSILFYIYLRISLSWFLRLLFKNIFILLHHLREVSTCFKHTILNHILNGFLGKGKFICFC